MKKKDLEDIFNLIQHYVFENETYVYVEFDKKEFFEKIGMMKQRLDFVSKFNDRKNGRMILKYKK